MEYFSGSLTHCKSLSSVTLQKLYVHRNFLSILPGKIRVPGKRVTHIKHNPQILEAVITFRELGRNVALCENLIPYVNSQVAAMFLVLLYSGDSEKDLFQKYLFLVSISTISQNVVSFVSSGIFRILEMCS